MIAKTSSKSRPLSPHLQVYRPQISSVMSILHRITGIGLTIGLPILVLWLVCLAGGPDSYTKFLELSHTYVGQVLMFGWTWAFFYHFCCGIRHLFWDAGFFIKIKGLYLTGWLALGVSTLLTAALWLKAYGYLP